MWKIILAEDETLLRKALKKILSSNSDYEICCEARNGMEALKYLETHKADIIISDIRMPNMDGLELIQKIKEKNISIKTIILSGYSDFEYARHMLIYNAFSYLLKPVIPEELLKTVDEACQEIKREQRNNSIIKSHTFQSFQHQGYAHFTNEMPSAMLQSEHLIALCIDFEKQPTAESLIQYQLDFEKIIYPCCCFYLDSYLYLVADISLPEKDLDEILSDIQMYYENISTSVRIGIGLETDTMMGVSLSMKQARKSLHYYHNLPYHTAVSYERISLIENTASTYPLTEEKNILDAVMSTEKENIHTCMLQIQKHFSSQSTEIIYQNISELFFACRRELSRYRVPIEWDDFYYSIQIRLPWKKLLTQFETMLTDYHSALQTARKSGNAPVIIKAKKYIEEHFKESLSLDEIADYCFLSKSHFCRIFKNETGLTFKAYLNQVRISSAKVLLKSTSWKNYEIAEHIGFDDTSYFNELFKKSTGMTPNEYRKSLI